MAAAGARTTISGIRFNTSPTGTRMLGSTAAGGATEVTRGRFVSRSPGIGVDDAGDGTPPGNSTSHGDIGTGFVTAGGTGLVIDGA
jgi:hypothetical protein